MITNFRTFGKLALLLSIVALGAFGQITMTQTTLSQAADARATVVHVASATGIAEAGNLIDGSLGPPSGAGAIILYVDKEAMRVVSFRGTAVTVSRGYAGTKAAAHASGAVAYIGQAGRYALSDPAGPCTVTSSTVLPRVVIPTGKVFRCIGSNWVASGEVFRTTGTFTAAAIAANACGAAVTTAVTGILTTDVVYASTNAAPDAETRKGLVYYAYPTANNVNVLVCNPTAGALTPAANLVFNIVAVIR